MAKNSKNKSLPLKIDWVRSSRAKYLRITIKADRSLRVTIPRKISLRQAEDFLASKKGWVEMQLKKMERLERVRPKQEEVDVDRLNSAQEEIFARLNEFSKRYGLVYNRAAFRCQKTIWGSCSGKNNISFNINMALLPRHLQDYVILHELCHVRHKNHGRAFWGELDRYTAGRAKELSKELRNYRIRIRR